MTLSLKARAAETNTPQKVNDLIARCQRYGIGDIFFYIGRCPVFCHTTLLSEQRTVASFDPLGALLEAAHNAGIGVYAWWGVGGIPRTWAGTPLAAAHPEWDVASLGGVFTNYHFMDWRQAGVKELITGFTAELLDNYPTLRGVTLDTFWYGVPSGAGEARALYGGDSPAYLMDIAQAAHDAVGSYQFGIHVLLDYYGYYLCQCWDKWLDAGAVDFVIGGAYYNSDRTFGADIPQTFEWAVNSWNKAYWTHIIPCISAIDFLDIGEVLRDTQNFINQYRLCTGFNNVAIFDTRVTDAMLEGVSNMVIDELQKLADNARANAAVDTTNAAAILAAAQEAATVLNLQAELWAAQATAIEAQIAALAELDNRLDAAAGVIA